MDLIEANSKKMNAFLFLSAVFDFMWIPWLIHVVAFAAGTFVLNHETQIADIETIRYAMSSTATLYGILIGAAVTLVTIVFSLSISQQERAAWPVNWHSIITIRLFTIIIWGIYTIVSTILTGASFRSDTKSIGTIDLLMWGAHFLGNMVLFLRLTWSVFSGLNIISQASKK